VRRIGGGYGAKIGQSIQVSAACAVAADALNRPVRLIMPLETNMAAIGKRPPAAIDYEVSNMHVLT
jgi:xanthine dehydrogenase molybdopterin-binding subunit B